MNDAEKNLVRKTATLLASRPVQRVNFWFKGVVIGPGQYRYISECLTWSLSHKGLFGGVRGIGVEIKKMPANTGAQYDSDDNVIEVPHGGFGDTPWERMTLVHECAHACIDGLYAKQKVPRLTNEACAYLAGAFYNVHAAASADGPFAYTPGSSGIFAEAHKIAVANRRYAERIGFTGVLQVFESEASDLLRAIKESKTYKGYFDDPAATYDDNGIKF